jgi:hypothetical protein
MGMAYPAIGAAIALAGGDKLAGLRGYDRMFRNLGWTREAVQAEAAAETAGGLLMMVPQTRRLGGLMVTAASAALLLSETRHREAKLALPRALMLAAGVMALLAPGKPS